MVKFVSLLLSALLFMGVSAPLAPADEDARAYTVVVTSYPLYDMALSLAGERANIVLSDEYVQGCEIVLCAGGQKDAWTNELEGVTVIRAIDAATLLLTLDGMPADTMSPPDTIDSDVLTVPINIVMCAYALADTLSSLDTSYAETYYSNLDEYANQIFALDAKIREVAARQVICCPDGSMAYFAQEYGLMYVPDESRAIALYAYNQVDAEDVAYIELMERNVLALAGN